MRGRFPSHSAGPDSITQGQGLLSSSVLHGWSLPGLEAHVLALPWSRCSPLPPSTPMSPQSSHSLHFCSFHWCTFHQCERPISWLSSLQDCGVSESGRRSVSITPGTPGSSVLPGARGCVLSELCACTRGWMHATPASAAPGYRNGGRSFMSLGFASPVTKGMLQDPQIKLNPNSTRRGLERAGASSPTSQAPGGEPG